MGDARKKTLFPFFKGPGNASGTAAGTGTGTGPRTAVKSKHLLVSSLEDHKRSLVSGFNPIDNQPDAEDRIELFERLRRFYRTYHAQKIALGIGQIVDWALDAGEDELNQRLMSRYGANLETFQQELERKKNNGNRINEKDEGRSGSKGGQLGLQSAKISSNKRSTSKNNSNLFRVRNNGAAIGNGELRDQISIDRQKSKDAESKNMRPKLKAAQLATQTIAATKNQALRQHLRQFYVVHDPVKLEDKESFEKVLIYIGERGIEAVNEKLMRRYGDCLDVQSLGMSGQNVSGFNVNKNVTPKGLNPANFTSSGKLDRDRASVAASSQAGENKGSEISIISRTSRKSEKDKDKDKDKRNILGAIGASISKVAASTSKGVDFNDFVEQVSSGNGGNSSSNAVNGQNGNSVASSQKSLSQRKGKSKDDRAGSRSYVSSTYTTKNIRGGNVNGSKGVLLPPHTRQLLDLFYACYDPSYLNEEDDVGAMYKFAEKNGLDSLNDILKERYSESFKEFSLRAELLQDELISFYNRVDPDKLANGVDRILRWALRNGKVQLNRYLYKKYATDLKSNEEAEQINEETVDLDVKPRSESFFLDEKEPEF